MSKTIHERMGISKSDRRYLWDYTCPWCLQSLARETCGLRRVIPEAAEIDLCSSDEMAERRRKCLDARRPKRAHPNSR